MSAIKVSQEVLEGLEAVRSSGKTNMFDVVIVSQIAEEMGHSTTAEWVLRNQQTFQEGIFNGFEAIETEYK